jgi:hypothetical protein
LIDLGTSIKKRNEVRQIDDTRHNECAVFGQLIRGRIKKVSKINTSRVFLSEYEILTPKVAQTVAQFPHEHLAGTQHPSAR